MQYVIFKIKGIHRNRGKAYVPVYTFYNLSEISQAAFLA